VWCLLAVTACTTAGHSGQAPKDHLIAVGWVQAAGEIRIYSRQADLGKLYDGTCISGVMTERRTMPASLQSQHVSVYGTLVDAREFDQKAQQLVTTGVENYCSSEKIAIITRLVEADVSKQ
jgi:hypothetical protein